MSEAGAPVFVAGFPRSGTTLLQRLIGSHPDIAAPPEVHFFARVHDFADLWGDLADDANLRRVVQELCRPPELVASDLFDEASVYERAAASGRSYRDLFEALMVTAAERLGKRRWSEKTPGQEVTRIWGLFPEAQVVHIVRDARDVVASVRSTPWVHTRSGVADVAADWARFNLHTIRAGMDHGPDRYLMIRYEDLVRSPATVMRTVFGFLGERFSPDLLGAEPSGPGPVATEAAWWQRRSLQPVAAGPLMQWRRTLSRADQAQVWAATRHLLIGLGYPPQRRAMAAAGGVLRVAPRVRRRWVDRAVDRRARTPEQRHAMFAAYVRRQVANAASAPRPGNAPSTESAAPGAVTPRALPDRG